MGFGPEDYAEKAPSSDRPEDLNTKRSERRRKALISWDYQDRLFDKSGEKIGAKCAPDLPVALDVSQRNEQSFHSSDREPDEFRQLYTIGALALSLLSIMAVLYLILCHR
ncbi:hypothetical protein [Agrobacterium sp.]|jgi:hypothetical protein|uniref:hypothetical protein n=1 Tax=Agrobacterium sp. TaxID=361 RepID=UPI0028AB2980